MRPEYLSQSYMRRTRHTQPPTPRTLREAFGPYTDDGSLTPMPGARKSRGRRIVYVAVIVLLALLVGWL